MPNIWATFVRKFITKNFLKQPNLVTLDWIKIGLQSLSYTLAQKLDVAPTRSLVTKEAKFSHKEEGTKIKSKMEISFSLSLSLSRMCVCLHCSTFLAEKNWFDSSNLATQRQPAIQSVRQFRLTNRKPLLEEK